MRSSYQAVEKDPLDLFEQPARGFVQHPASGKQGFSFLASIAEIF
jgi:hypothetical protein